MTRSLCSMERGQTLRSLLLRPESFLSHSPPGATNCGEPYFRPPFLLRALFGGFLSWLLVGKGLGMGVWVFTEAFLSPFPSTVLCTVS